MFSAVLTDTVVGAVAMVEPIPGVALITLACARAVPTATIRISPALRINAVLIVKKRCVFFIRNVNFLRFLKKDSRCAGVLFLYFTSGMQNRCMMKHPVLSQPLPTKRSV